MKKLFMLLASIALLAAVFSCQSTPPPAPAPVEKPKEAPAVVKPQEPPKEVPLPPAPVVKAEEPPPPPKVEAPADLKAQALALRNRAFDLKLSEVIPSDYAAAEKAYGKGNDSYEKDNAASKAAFEDAIKLFVGVLDKGLPLRAQGKKDKAAEWRDKALKANAAEALPVLLGVADGTFGCGDAFANFGDYESAAETYDQAGLQYGILIKVADAKAKRDLIGLKKYAPYEKGNFSIAEEKYALASNEFADDPQASLVAVDEAILRYGKVIDAGRQYKVKDSLGLAMDQMAKAVAARADVAVKDGYADADKLLNDARAKEVAGDLDAATDLYDAATAKFAQVANLALDKKSVAELNFEMLDMKKKASLDKIADAELVVKHLEGKKE
jgi:hypothetical protein